MGAAAAGDEDDDIQEVAVPVKAEPPHALAPHEEALAQYGEEGYEDYGQYEGEDGAYDTSMVGVDGNKGLDPDQLFQYVRRDPGDQRFYCTLCSLFSHASR